MENKIHPIFFEATNSEIWPQNATFADRRMSMEDSVGQMRAEMDRMQRQMYSLMGTTHHAMMPPAMSPSSPLMMPTMHTPYWFRPPGAMVPPPPAAFMRSMSATSGDGISVEVKNTPEKFEVSVDVSQYLPEEVSVKTIDNTLQVEAKHEERQDEHGFISRNFVRKYIMPKDVDPMLVRSKLSSEGVLTVEAPKKALTNGTNERAVPIETAAKK